VDLLFRADEALDLLDEVGGRVGDLLDDAAVLSGTLTGSNGFSGVAATGAGAASA
jgi:hypothetical protein